MLKTRLPLLILALFVAFSYWMPTPGWNELSRLDLVRAIVEEGTLRIDSYHSNTGDKASFEGHYYSDKAPGAALLGVPPHMVLWHCFEYYSETLTPYLLSLWAVAIPSVVACMLLLLILKRMMPAEERWGIVVVFAYALATIALPFSTKYFGHQISAAAIIAGFCLLTRDDRDVTFLTGFSAGSILGIAVLCDYPTLLIVTCVVGYAAWRNLKHGLPSALKATTLITLGGIPFAIALAFYNNECFGHPFANAYTHHITFGTQMRQGFFGIGSFNLDALYGVTVKPGHGLFYLSPFLLLSIFGIVLMIANRSSRGLGVFCAAASLLYLTFNSCYVFWEGVSSTGPRFLVPLIPILIIPIAHLIRRYTIAKWLLATLLIPSVFNIWLATASAVNPISEIDCVVWGYWITQVRSGSITPNLGTLVGLRGLPSTIPLALSMSGLLIPLLCFRNSQETRSAATPSCSLAPKIASFSACVAVGIAIIFVQQIIETRNKASYDYSVAEGLLASEDYATRPVFSEAEQKLKDATSIDPHLLKAWALLASVQVKLGRQEEALQTLLKASEITGREREAFQFFIAFSLRLGSLDFARAILRSRVNQYPNDQWSKDSLRSLESQMHR